MARLRRPPLPKLNPNHQLAAKLVGFWDFRRYLNNDGQLFYPVDRTFRPLKVIGSGPVWTTGSMGDGLWFDGTGSWKLELEFGGAFTDIAKDVTMVVVVERPAAVTDFLGGPFSMSDGSTSDAFDVDESVQTALRLRADGPGGILATTVSDPSRSDVNKPYTAAIVGGQDGFHRVIVASTVPLLGGTSTRYWGYVENAADFATYRPNNVARITVGTQANRYSAYVDPHHGIIYAVGLWCRSLHLNELLQLTLDPWAVVREDTVTFWIASTGAINADANLSVGQFPASSDADVIVSADANLSAGPFSVASDGSVEVDADANLVVGQFAVTSDADVIVSGDVSAGVGTFPASANASVEVDADGNLSVGQFAVSSSANVEVDADAALGIGAFAVASDADVIVSADVALATGPFPVSSTATVGDQINANANLSVGQFAVSAAGNVEVSAEGSLAAPTYAVSSDADVIVDADVSVSSGPFAVASAADVIVDGDASLPVGQFGLVADADVIVGADAQLSVGAFGLNAGASAVVGADGQIGIGPYIASASGNVVVGGDVALVMAAYSVASAVDIIVSASATLGVGQFVVRSTGGAFVPAEATKEAIARVRELALASAKSRLNAGSTVEV